MHEFDSTSNSDADSLADFEHSLRALEPRPANFDIADLNSASLSHSQAVPSSNQSAWITIAASWSLGAAAGILGTLLSLNLGLNENDSTTATSTSAPNRVKTSPQSSPPHHDRLDHQSVGAEKPEPASEINLANSRESKLEPSFAVVDEPFSVLAILDQSRQLTPRQSSFRTATTTGQLRFNPVTLRTPIRSDTPTKVQSGSENSRAPTTDSETPDEAASPNRRQMLRNMLDPFTST